MSIDKDILDPLLQTSQQFLLELCCLFDPELHFLSSDLSGDTHTDDGKKIFCSGSLVVFLDTTIYERPDSGASADVQATNTRRSIELIGGKTKEIHAEFLDIYWHNPH